MERLNIVDAARRIGISERTLRSYATQGRIDVYTSLGYRERGVPLLFDPRDVDRLRAELRQGKKVRR